MAVFETNRVALGANGGVFGRLFAAIAAWNDARVTRQALSRLSDRELDDIGLSRGDIAQVAARA